MNTMPVTGPVTGPPRSRGALRMTPGRWIALTIGVPFALALIGWSAFSLVANLGRASFPISTSIPVQNGQLVASTGGGDITVYQDQARSDKARLTGTVQYSLVRPNLTISGDGVHLDCRLPTGNCGLSAILDVPLDTAVNLASEGGNMQVSGIDRDVTLNSGGGDVTVSGVGGIVNASTGGGNVTLVFTRVPVYLNITSDGGDITIVLPRGSTPYAITYTTDGGDYSAQVPTTSSKSARNNINVQSGGGNISISQS